MRKLRDAEALLNAGRDLAAVLRCEGWTIAAKRGRRLCRREGVNARGNPRKKGAGGPSGHVGHLCRTEHKDHVWTWDLAFDRTTSGRTLQGLSSVDESTRECLAVQVSRNITSEDVSGTLAERLALRSVPRAIRSDNTTATTCGPRS